MGRSTGFISNPENLSSLNHKRNNIEYFFNNNKKNILSIVAILLIATFLTIIFL
jgi:acetyl-CoA carboxylase carboxyl transferase subunit alpha